MSDIAIRVENLSKLYRIGRAQQRHDTLRDALVSTFKRANAPTSESSSDLWALKDVSFEVQRGEAVGIIGRNGAGKSTLLKILSRITEPTRGRVTLDGRVASLLEVGTGFHPELTGRENIYLNGAILGMHRAEIGRRFDEIVAFAEIERFLDTPVKRYSSGMYVRLAFAVAAHLEPEILLVDEVLAVGDAAFQKKCLGKMGDVTQEGRTVVFVSHNMSAVQRLCPRTMLFSDGGLNASGDSNKMCELYLARDSTSAMPTTWMDLSGAQRRGSGEARFAKVWYAGGTPCIDSELRSGVPAEVRVMIQSGRSMSLGSLAFSLYDLRGIRLVNADSLSLGHRLRLRQGMNQFRISVTAINLNPGTYVLGLWMAHPSGGAVDYIESAFEVQVFGVETLTLGVRPPSDGVVTCEFQVHEMMTECNADGLTLA